MQVKPRQVKFISTFVPKKTDQIRLLPGEVEVGLPGHGDVGEVLLQDKDVPAHLLDTRLADPLEVLGPVD